MDFVLQAVILCALKEIVLLYIYLRWFILHVYVISVSVQAEGISYDEKKLIFFILQVSCCHFVHIYPTEGCNITRTWFLNV